MKEYTVIGHFDWNTPNIHGAATKSRAFLKAMQLLFKNNSVDALDIAAWKKNKLKISFFILKHLLSHKTLIFVSSTSNLKTLSFITHLALLLKRRVLYVLVGGELFEKANKSKKINKLLFCFDSIWVETADCFNGLKSLSNPSKSI